MIPDFINQVTFKISTRSEVGISTYLMLSFEPLHILCPDLKYLIISSFNNFRLKAKCIPLYEVICHGQKSEFLEKLDYFFHLFTDLDQFRKHNLLLTGVCGMYQY